MDSILVEGLPTIPDDWHFTIRKSSHQSHMGWYDLILTTPKHTLSELVTLRDNYVVQKAHALLLKHEDAVRGSLIADNEVLLLPKEDYEGS